MLNKLFIITRLFIVPVVISSFVAAVSLYVVVVFLMFNTIVDYFSNPPIEIANGKLLVVKFFKILDISLIAITFQVISLGLYRLFINNESLSDNNLLNALKIRSFHDLKSILLQVSVVILVVMFLEHIVEKGASIDNLYMGISISAIIIAAVLSWKFMR